MAERTSIWTFPFRGKGLVVLLGGAGVIVLATLLASLSIPLVPATLTAVLGIYVGSYSYLIVRDTARGKNSVASWPGLPVTESFFVPVARILAGVLWGCLPAFLYRVLSDQPDILFWLLFLLGVYLLPMVVVRVATRESFLAGHPVATLISILRTIRDYTTTCVPYYVAVLAATFAATVFLREDWWEAVAAAHIAAYYLFLVTLYGLGLFHRRNADHLHLRGLLAGESEEEGAGEPPAEALAAPASESPAEPSESP